MQVIALLVLFLVRAKDTSVLALVDLNSLFLDLDDALLEEDGQELIGGVFEVDLSSRQVNGGEAVIRAILRS